MRTLNANFVGAFEAASCSPRVLVAIDLGGGNVKKARDGDTADSGMSLYPASVASVGSFNFEIDPWDRRPKIGQVRVDFVADGWFRDLVVNNIVRGKACTISLGERSHAESSYEPLFYGVIDDYQSKYDGTGHIIVSDWFAMVRDAEIVGYWLGKHPLEIILDILQNKIGIAASMIDSAAFDPTNYSTSISHWNLSRGGFRGETYSDDFTIREPTSAFKLIQELSTLMNGSTFVTELGKFTFKRFDESAGVSSSWSDQLTFTDIEFDQTSYNVKNRVTVSFWRRNYKTNNEGNYEANDTVSQSAHAFPGMSNLIASDKIDTSWLTAHGIIDADMTSSVPGVGATFGVSSGFVFGMSGTRWPSWPGGSQPATAQLSGSRTAFLAIDDEIIEVDQCTVGTSNGRTHQITDPATGGLVSVGLPYSVVFRVLARGAKGTTAAAHARATSSPITDMTIPIAMAESRIKRFSYGVPIIKTKTSFDYFHVEVGDMVTLISNNYFTYGNTGLDANTKWEVVGKKVETHTTEPGIEWTLAWATKTGAPGSANLQRYRRGVEGMDQVSLKASTGVVPSYVDSGLAVTGTGGFGVSVSTGKSSTALTSPSLPQAQAITVPASSDTWVYADANSGSVITKSVGIGAAEPVRAPSETPIARVRSDGAGVSGVLDTRSSQRLNTGIATAQNVSPRTTSDRGSIMNGKFHSWTRG